MTNPDRLRYLRVELAKRKLDGVLVTNPVNIGYMSGFSGSTAYVLVTGSEALLITDPRYTLRAKEEAPGFEIILAQGSGGYPEALKSLFTERPRLKTVAFEAGNMTVALYERLRKDVPDSVSWTATENLVEDLRLVKDAAEIAAIEAAIRLAQDAFREIKPQIKPGISERSVALILDHTMRMRGADEPAFETIVASGPLGARPHHTPSERLLQSGDLVTIDWGARLRGYCSDITRTLAIGGPYALGDEQRKIYEIVKEAQARAIAAMAPGKTGKDIDDVAREYIASQGYGDAFSHSLGHSLGRAVHDGPGLSFRSDKVILQPGMVMTVEPGIYVEGVGGVRIEEDVLISDYGCRVMTNLNRDLEFMG